MICQPAGAELLIYQPSVHRTFLLSGVTKEIFLSCQGAPLPEIENSQLELGLAELERSGLVEAAGRPTPRRSFLRAAALPLILSVAAPQPAQAASACFTCPDGAAFCANCAAAVGCQACGTTTTNTCPGSAADCRCTPTRIFAGTNCTAEVVAGRDLCLNFTMNTAPQVQADCFLARQAASTASGSYNLTYCDGTTFAITATRYFCCQNC